MVVKDFDQRGLYSSEQLSKTQSLFFQTHNVHIATEDIGQGPWLKGSFTDPTFILMICLLSQAQMALSTGPETHSGNYSVPWHFSLMAFGTRSLLYLCWFFASWSRIWKTFSCVPWQMDDFLLRETRFLHEPERKFSLTTVTGSFNWIVGCC